MREFIGMLLAIVVTFIIISALFFGLFKVAGWAFDLPRDMRMKCIESGGKAIYDEDDTLIQCERG